MPSTPMFPLGSVLVPGMVMPLHVFEDRYRALTERCIASGEAFGVTLIERGNEVGGGDTRFSVGCLAEIVESHRFDDGRWALLARGTERFVVSNWLDDEPYPSAEIRLIPHDDGELDRERVDEVGRRLRRVLALATEAGLDTAPATSDLSEQADERSWQVAAMAPLQLVDRQQLLATPSTAERIDHEIELLGQLEELLRSQLA